MANKDFILRNCVVWEMRRRQQYQIKWFRIIMAGFAVYFCYHLIGLQGQLSNIEQETAAARQRVEQARQSNAALVQERERLQTPAYVEKLAREELGLVKPGEIPYVPAAK